MGVVVGVAVARPVAVGRPQTDSHGSPRQTSHQARFQQKQLQEKEQKLLALYEEQANQGHHLSSQGRGKVRQLFQERRGQSHHSGWDKSYPLNPILDRNLNIVWKEPLRSSRRQPRNDLRPSRSSEPLYQLAYKYKSPAFYDDTDYLSRSHDLELSRIFRKLPNIGGASLSDSADSQINQPTATMAPAKEQKTQSRIPNVTSVTKSMAKMSPPSKKPEIKSLASTTNSQIRSIPVPLSNSKPRTLTSAPEPVTKPTIRQSPVTQVSEPPKMNRAAVKPGGTNTAKTTAASTAPKNTATPRGPTTGGRSDLVPCRICGRNFAPDRVQAHAEICAKTSRKKRKPFDVTKQRVKGTDLEAYTRKGKASQPPPKKTGKEMLQPLTKSNWRRKHEEFISNIRAAKQAQAHVAKGGKLSDLPPPPPMDTSDLIPCPHCKRKFNEAAAERHIPKCANMLHNKPKPTANTKAKTITRKY